MNITGARGRHRGVITSLLQAQEKENERRKLRSGHSLSVSSTIIVDWQSGRFIDDDVWARGK